MKEYKGFRAERLREIMKLRDIEEDDLAAALRKNPIFSSFPRKRAKEYISGVVQKHYTPSISALFVICDVCSCSADYLLGLSDNKEVS